MDEANAGVWRMKLNAGRIGLRGRLMVFVHSATCDSCRCLAQIGSNKSAVIQVSVPSLVAKHIYDVEKKFLF